jgi:hypothetical protein
VVTPEREEAFREGHIKRGGRLGRRTPAEEPSPGERAEHERALRQPLTSRCGRCGWSVTAPAAEAITAARAHRRVCQK